MSEDKIDVLAVVCRLFVEVCNGLAEKADSKGQTHLRDKFFEQSRQFEALSKVFKHIIREEVKRREN